MIVSYTDCEYLPRFLALLRSLRRCTGREEGVSVLALDAWTEQKLRIIDDYNLTVYTPSDLDSYIPGFLTKTGSRKYPSAVCLKHPFVKLMLEKYDLVEYFEPHCYFFSGWDRLRSSYKDINIIPYMFPEIHKHPERFGKYQTGCMIFRRCDASLRFLQDWIVYTENHDEPHFLEQLFLDDCINKFDVHEIIDPGLGLGPWNQLFHLYSTDRDGKLLVDNVPLTMYPFYFHKMDLDRRDGTYVFQRGACQLHPVIMEKVYGPYEQELVHCRYFLS